MSTTTIHSLRQPAVQLWCVRDALARDPDATLSGLHDAGFSAVEPYSVDDFPGLGAALAANGLGAPSVHEHLVDADVQHAFDLAESVGAGLVIESWTAPDLWRSATSVHRLARALNDAGVAAAERGLRVGYHNHEHELAQRIDGQPALFVFADALADEVVLQIDLATVRTAGVDPRDVWSHYGDRVESVHVLGEVGATAQLWSDPGGDLARDVLGAPPGARVIIEVEDGPMTTLTRARTALLGLRETP